MNRDNDKDKDEKSIENKFFENTKKHILEDEINIEKSTSDLLLSYERAVFDTENRIRSIYSKFAKDNDLSLKEAKKLIEDSEYKVFRKTLAEYMKDISNEGENSKTLAELNILSAKSRLSREENLLASIYIEMSKMADKTNEELEDALKHTLKTNFKRGAYDLQTALGAYYKVADLPELVVEKIVNTVWAKNKFSKSVWKHVDTLNFHIKEVITDGFIQGKSVDKMVRSLKERTGAAKNAVSRVIKTEIKHFANMGEMQGYKANGITKYVYIGTTEKGYTCNCASLNNTIIDVADIKPLVNFPPLHPNCKCSTRAHFEDSVLENKKLVHFDKKLSVDEWSYKFLEKNEKDLLDKLKNKLNCDIVKVNKIDFENLSLANKATYLVNAKGQVKLSIYGDNGRVIKQFHNNDHDNPKDHNAGKYGEHMHDWDYRAYIKELVEYKKGSKKDAKGKKIKKPKPARKWRPCTKEEQEIMEELL